MSNSFDLPFSQSPNPGVRLGDLKSMYDAIIGMNGMSRAYGIAATGTTQSTATQLTCVINEVDSSPTSSNGVNLPSSTGASNTPYAFCVIINNDPANSIQVFAAQGTSDTINNTAGSTGITQNSGITSLYVSAKPGAWFRLN